MSKKLYVASLPFSVNTDAELTAIFEAIGTVTSAKIIVNAKTGVGKGIGFVEMGTEEEAAAAISQLNESTYGGRKIKVTEARSETRSADDAEE